MKAYTPSQAVLTRYADVLVNFALGHGKGIKSGDVVYLNGSEAARPLIVEVQKAIWEKGGHVLLHYFPDGEDRYSLSADFFERAKDHQLDFFPKNYFRGLVDDTDHILFILGDNHPHALKGADPKKIMRRGLAMKQFMDWRRAKEHQGKLSWTIALYGTPAMAREAGLSQKEYWHEIIQACFLDQKNPIKKWDQVYKEIHSYNKKLDALSPKIDRLHIEGEDADLWITLGKNRKWLSGRGANIPSFEIFTSPDWRGTNGWIRFNQPLYRYGNKVTGIELWFKDGKVIKSKARTGEKLLKEMIATAGADRIGEFSMTDRRHSRITKFMAETLFDENMGGPQGNTHIALGSAYEDTHTGDVSKLSKSKSAALGFNDSSVHTDIITTTRRRVTAHLVDGRTKIIYDNGQFVL
ncbi:MAG TPA: aminopeptidase [Candidatus Paceibacterota bacterium]|nr:aminopeptidase [Candidatus Paceibacterota bacterium]